MDIDALRSAVEETPTDVGAFTSLQDALIEAQRLKDLKEVYEMVFTAVKEAPERDRILRVVDQRARTVEDLGIRHWLNVQLGLMFWKTLENPDRAEVYFRRVQDAAGQKGIVGDFYTEFYAKRENWRRLEQLYTQQGHDPIDVKRRLAGIAEERGKKDKALAFLQAVYNAEPGDDETYEKLKGLYTEVRKWHSLIELLKKRLKVLDGDTDAQVDVHLEMIEVYSTHIKSDTKVVATWQAILSLRAGDARALDALQALYEKMKRWPDLVRVLQQRIDHSEDTGEQLALHQRIASIMLERFSNSSEAIKHYQAILEIDPENLGALGELKSLYEQRKAWEQYVEVAQREIGLTAGSPAERSSALIALAALASERIRHPRIAMSLWEEIRSADPDNLDALTQLAGLYERDKAYDKLVDVLDATVEHTADPGEKTVLLEKLGLIWGTRLKDDERTSQVWRRVLELNPGHRKAFTEMRKRSLSAQDWEGLEWLYRNHGEVSELVRTLQSQVRSVSDEERGPLLAKVAELWLDQGDVSKGVKALEQLLELDPSNVEAARQLVPIYTDRAEWEKLPDAYDVVLEGLEDVAERQDLLVAKARVQEEELQDLDAAFFCYVEAYREDVQSGDIRAHFDRLAEASENWDIYASVLEQVVELRSDDRAFVVATTLRAAEVHHRRLQNHDQALEHYREILDTLDPENTEALDATEQIYREQGQWDELIDILHAKLQGDALTSDDEKSLRFEIGSVWRDKLEEPEAAMGVYREMMERFPGDVRIYDELAHLHMQAEEWDSLSDVLDRKLSALADRSDSAPEALADLHCKLGMLAYAQLGDAGLAVERYTDALHADPNCDLAIHSLEELLASSEFRERIALALEPVYRERGEDAELADVLEIQLAGATKKRGRVSLLQRLVDLYHMRVKDPERALWAASRLFELSPGRKSLRPTIEALSEELGEWAHLADLYEAHAGEIKNESARLEVYQTIAQTAHSHLEDPERAELHYLLILEDSPEHESTLDSLEFLYGETDQPERLLGILRKKEALATTDEERIDYRFQTASILADRLDRIDDAVADMQEVLGISPRHPMALARLDDMYTRTDSWLDLHDVLRDRISLSDSDEERVSHLLRLATLREAQLESPSDAIETYSEILAIDVLQPEATTALERLFANEDYSVRIAPLLEPTYKASDDWRGLVRTYEVMERAADTAEEKVEFHNRMAKIYEHQGNTPDRAFAHYGEAYRLVPDGESTMAQLLRLADVLDNYADLTVLLRERVEDAADPDRRREIHRVIAQTLGDRCADPQGAIAHYCSVLDISSDDLPATDALIDLYRMAEDWESLVDMLCRKAPMMEVDELRKELLLEAGEIAAASLEDPQTAISVYEQVLAIDPDDEGGLDALGDLYEQTSQWNELCGILRRKIERAREIDERKIVARELAGVQEVYLEDLEAAIETHRQILAWDPADLAQLNTLDELLKKTEAWLDLLLVIDQEIDLVPDDAKSDLALRKARIWHEELEDTVEAISVLDGVLSRTPDELRAQQSLEDIVRSTEHAEAAFEVLRPVLVNSGQWGRVYDLLDHLVGERDDPFSRIEALHDMGAIAEDRMTDPEKAFGCYGRALQEDLGHEDSMAAVERLASTNQLWEPLTLLLSDGASAAVDPQRKLELRLRAAEVLKDDICDLDRSITVYSQVLEDQPANPIALESLDELYLVTERWVELSRILNAEVDNCDDVDKKVALYFRLAEVSEHKLGDPDQPFHCYREVFYLEPTNAEAIEHLERLARAGAHRGDIAALLEPVYVERAQWQKLHDLLELRLESAEDEADRLELLRRIAELNLEHLDQKGEAVRRFGEAFRLDPGDDLLLGRLEGLVAETDDYTPLKEVLLAVAIGMEDVDRKIMLWHKAARILEEHLIAPSEAEMIYQLILAEDEDLTALQALDRLYVTQERWEELEVALERQIDAVDYDDDRIALLVRLGELLRDRLERPTDAIDAYIRALELHETHAVALDAVAKLYRSTEQWSALFDVLRRQADVSETDEARLGHLRDMAGIAEVYLEKPADAIELSEEILTISPDDMDAVRDIQRLHREANAWTPLVEAIERELGILAGRDDERAADLYRDLGRLWSGELDDPLQAQEAWQHLLAVRDNDLEAMRALASIHETECNYEALGAILEKSVASLQFEGDELHALYVQMARLYSDTLPEPARAVQAWEKVRETTPDDMEAVEALERLLTEQGRWDAAVAIMEVKASLVPREESVAVWLTLGETQQYQLSSWESAAEAYRAALEIEPSHLDASERLEAIYTEHAQWERLSQLLDARGDFIEEGEEKRDLFVRLADVYESRLEDPGTALLYLQAAHRQSIGDVDVLSALARVGTATEQWGDLLEEFTVAVEAFDDDFDKIDYTLRCASLLREKLDRPEDAIARYREVLALDAEHQDALTALSELLEQTEQWSDLVEVLERRLMGAPSTFEATQIGLRIGGVLRDKVADTDRAVEAYRRVLDGGEGEAESIDALQTLFETNERWADLIEILEAKAGSGLGDETEIKLRVARIMEEKLSDVDGAIDTYEQILTFDETNRVALDRLLELYADRDDMEALTGVYERLLHTADSDEDQIQYCEALALLHESAHQNPESAADYYHRVLQIQPQHNGALESLEQIYSGLEQWEDLIDVYRRRLDQHADDDSQWVGYKEKSAQVYHERLNDPDNAIYAYQELVTRVPAHRPALDALEGLFRSTDQWEQVQDVIGRKADLVETAPERIELNCERARILLEDLSDPDGAIDILNRALGEDAGNVPALSLLEKVYTVRSEWENVIEVLRRRELHAASDADKADVQVRIADVYRDRLSDGMSAIEHYERALEFVPDDVRTAERLAGLYVIAEDWVKAEGLLALIAERVPEDADSKWLGELHYNRGLALENLLRPSEALAEYETAHSTSPDDMDVLKALGRMAYGAGEFDRAEEIYTSTIERLGDTAPDEELVELYKTLGQIALKRGADEQAREYLEKTIQLQPGNAEALKSLISLCEQQEYWRGVVDYASELQTLLSDPLERFELQVRIGDVCLKYIDAPDEAVMAYHSALDYQPESKAAHFKIFQVLVDAERYPEAIDILSRLVELEDSPKSKAKYLGAIGDIYREKMGEPLQGVEFYNQALDHDPSLLKLFRAIDEILTRAKDWKELQRAYRSMLKRVGDDDSQHNLQYKLCFNLGEIYRTRLKNMDRSRAAFEAALNVRPNDLKTLQILAELYELADQMDEAIEMERRLLRAEPGNVTHYRHLKRLFRDTGDTDAAWVACSVLHLLGQANERETEFYEAHARPTMIQDPVGLEGDIWVDHLLSKGEDPTIGLILLDIFRGIGAQIVTKTLKSHGLKKKHKVDPNQRELFTYVYGTAASVLALNPRPEVYAPGRTAGLIIEETLPPVMCIGDDLRQGRTEAELAFVLGKALTYFYEPHQAVVLAQQQMLMALFQAAIKLFYRDHDVGALESDENFNSLLEALSEMPTQLRQSLGKHVQEFMARGSKVNLARWLNQIELTANHAGLVICNDPVIAGKAIKSEAHRALFTAPSRLGTREKLVDLAVYALGDEYLSLRKKLGVVIDED